MITFHTFTTPIAELSVLVADDAIVAAGFCPPDPLFRRLPAGSTDDLAEVEHLGAFHEPILAYFDGKVDALDHLAVAQPGTKMQQEVWDALRGIPAGQTRTYSELAASVERPRAVRAAGTACGRNLIAPMVPCHRALRSDGSLGGYLYGLDVKRWLLDHELANRG